TAARNIAPSIAPLCPVRRAAQTSGPHSARILVIPVPPGILSRLSGHPHAVCWPPKYRLEEFLYGCRVRHLREGPRLRQVGVAFASSAQPSVESEHPDGARRRPSGREQAAHERVRVLPQGRQGAARLIRPRTRRRFVCLARRESGKAWGHDIETII